MEKREKLFAVIIGILLVINIINYSQIGGLRETISTLESKIMNIFQSKFFHPLPSLLL